MMAKRQAGQFSWVQADLRGKADLAEQEARLAEGLLAASEAREAKLKEELGGSRDETMAAKVLLRRKEEELLNKTECATELEKCLVDAAAREMCWESQAFLAKERAIGAERRAQEAESEARAAWAEAEVARREAVRAVEDFRVSVELKAEVEEAVCNTYIKGFTECKARVQELYSGVDLREVVAEEEDEAEEEDRREEPGQEEEAAEGAVATVGPAKGAADEGAAVVASTDADAREDSIWVTVARAMVGIEEAIAAVGAVGMPPPPIEG